MIVVDELSLENLKLTQDNIPIYSNKVLIDLVGSIQVNQDLIDFRQNQGFLGQILNNVTGADYQRQLRIDDNFSKGMQSLHNWILGIVENFNISNHAITIVEKKLLEARQAIRNHRQEMDFFASISKQLQTRIENYEDRLRHLEARVYHTEAQNKIDRIISAWSANRTYQTFHWTIQIACIVREIVDYILYDYERITAKDTELRQYIINKLLRESINTIPDHFVPLSELLNLAHNQTSDEILEIASYLLEVHSIPPERLTQIPYLFTLGKTLELAQLPKSDRPVNPAKAAFTLCRQNFNSMIYAATSKKEFVERIVNETANDRLRQCLV